jgi:hypothetical protein
VAILTRPRFLPQQRLDLEDINALLAALRTDSKLYTKQLLSANNLIFKGFSVTGIGLKQATVAMADATLVIPQNSNDFSWFTAAPAEANIIIPDADLVDGVRNYVEISLQTQNNTPLTKAFWDPEANSGLGSEFNQIVATITDLSVKMIVSTGGFSGSVDRLPLCIIDTDGSGNIKTILDRRNLFGRLGTPVNINNRYSWGARLEPAYTMQLNGTVGLFVAGELVTIGTETATVVTGGTTSITFMAPSGINFFPGNSVTGGTSGATATVDTISESFIGADKNLKTQKDINDALMSEIALVKGTPYWYQDPSISLSGIVKALESVLVQATATAKFVWDGTNLEITDDNVTPANDTLGYIRILGRTGNLSLTREDGTGGTSTIAIADGQVLYVKIPTSGSRTFSASGSGDTNFQVAAIGTYQSADTTYWLAYREGTRLYIRGYGELEPGEEINIGDPELEEILAAIAVNQDIETQDRNIKLIEGGTVSFLGTTLTFGSDSFIQVPGLLRARNRIAAQTINLPNATSVAYVDINRSGVTPAALTVVVADEDAITNNVNRVVIARRVTAGALVGNKSFLLKNGEKLELDGALAEINRYMGQLKIKEHISNVSKIIINPADSLLLNGATLSQIVGNFLLNFTGAVINFTTGAVLKEDDSTPLGANFTPFSIPVGEYFWYGISLLPDDVNADNTQNATVQIDLADSANASASLAPKPVITGTIKLGAIQVQNIGGTITVVDVKPLGVGSGSGSGDGQGASFDAEMRTYLKLSPYEFATTNLIPVDQDDNIDPASTGVYSPASKTFKQTVGQTLLSTELLDADFIAATRPLAKARVILRYASTSIDPAPVVAVQKNGGSFQTVTMSRIGNTDTFDGEITLDAAVGTSLKLRVTASATAEIYGYGVLYDTTFVAIPMGLAKNIHTDSFAGLTGVKTCTLPFIPDPNALVIYDKTRGQAYVYDPANTFSISGNDVVFVADFFNFPGETISLEFRQIIGNGIDSSDQNANNIATNTTNIARLDTASRFRNYLTNSEMRFAQRQDPAVMTTRTDAQFGMDRWKVLNSGGTGVGVIRVDGDVPLSATQARFSTRLRQLDATARQFGTVQFIDYNRCKELRGKEATFGFWMKTTGTQIPTLRAAIVEWTGSVDSVTSDIVSSWASTPTLVASTAYVTTPADIAVTSTWSYYEVTGSFSGSMNNAGVFIYTPNAEAQNDEFFMTQAQLVRGNKSRNWEAISLTFEEDYRECAAFYQKSFELDTAPTNSGTTTSINEPSSAVSVNHHNSLIGVSIQFPVRMRAVPSMTRLGSSNGRWIYYAINNAAPVEANLSTDFIGVTTKGFTFAQQAVAAMVTISGHYTAQAEIF